jgi:hypothetical protein
VIAPLVGPGGLATVLAAATYTGPPELTVGRALTSWTLDPGGLVLVLALGIPYLLAVRRVGRAGGRWSVGRSLAYSAGLVTIVVATMSFLGVYAHVLFWVTSVQLALLLTVAPVLLSLGAPVTLVRSARPSAGDRVDRVAASAPVRLLTFPLVAGAVVAVVPLLVWYTPLQEASVRQWWVYWSLHAGLVVVGLAFFWPVLAVDAVGNHALTQSCWGQDRAPRSVEQPARRAHDVHPRPGPQIALATPVPGGAVYAQGGGVPRCHPTSTTAVRVQRHEVLADVDVDVAHVGIGHGAAGLVIGDQPLHHLAFAAAGLEIDRLAACVLRDAARAGDASAGAARGDDLHGAELTLDAIEQLPRGRLQAREQEH